MVSSFVSLYLMLFLALNPTPWNFPGDPPLFELSLEGAVAGLILVGPLWLLLRYPPGRSVNHCRSAASGVFNHSNQHEVQAARRAAAPVRPHLSEWAG